MTDTLHKNPESCTGSDTPETDAYRWSDDRSIYGWSQFAEKLERERDEARAELAFRLERNTVQQVQLSELRKQLAEAVSSCNIWQKGHSALVEDRNKTVFDCYQQTNKIAAEREGWKKIAVEQEKDIDALRKELEHAKSYKKVMKEQHKQLTSRLDVLSKNNRKLSTLLQEHGLSEYGN